MDDPRVGVGFEVIGVTLDGGWLDSRKRERLPPMGPCLQGQMRGAQFLLTALQA